MSIIRKYSHVQHVTRGCRRWWRTCSRWGQCYRLVEATTAASVPPASTGPID